MYIKGINLKKCIACKICIKECPAGLYSINDEKKIEYNDPNKWCINCGHCIAACPEDAINYISDEKAMYYDDGNLTKFDDLVKLLHTKRTIRNYKNEEVPKKEIEKIFDAMRFAPSGHNYQTCEYLVIKSREKMKLISDETIKSFKSFRRLIRMHKILKPFIPKNFYKLISDPGIAIGIDDMISKYHSGKDIILFDAPVTIIVHVPNLGPLSYVDPTISFTYGMLAAYSIGLGTCWIGFAMMALGKNKKIFKEFNIDKTRIITGVMTMGYPVNKYYRIPVRNKINEKWYI